MKTTEIKQRWLNFFQAKGHTVVPSASLISDDPSLLFTVAGMVPFVPYLTGLVPAPFPRATSVQKCIRTNDIEEVGKTPRHGTFFQMNGNFSFGDYFKAEAIAFAWELLTTSEESGGLGFDPNDLWVTVYEEDDEALNLWLKTSSLPAERIQKLGKDTNYWHTGQPGPAGPCSEIFFDRGPAYGIDGGPATDDDRYVEIWNLVFMEFLIDNVRSKTDFDIVSELPKKNIDTGMGLERVAFIKQGVDNMYEIDEVRPVLDAAAILANKVYGENQEDDVRLRVVADHIRSSLMLINDGVVPSNEARGYILRRLMRRVIRAMRLLGVTGVTFPVLFEKSYQAMRFSYPELDQNFDRILAIVTSEEETFLRTLSSGTTILENAVEQSKAKQETSLSGETAFLLHDTYGFPIDLTIEIAAEAGLPVNRQVFEKLMTEQRQRARQDAKSKLKLASDPSVYRNFRALGETDFRGYSEFETQGSVIGLVADHGEVKSASAGQTIEVILSDTTLYPEGGGQDSDHGTITGPGFELEVLDVQKPIPGLISHLVRVVEGEIGVGDLAVTKVDNFYRYGANQAHSATHIVHAALRQLLGKTAHQSGSYNKSGYMRLDYSWNQALSPSLLTELEEVSNLAIRSDYEVVTKILPIDEAKALGAMALFGEKYGDLVRMVDMNGEWSRELCAGTHVSSTAQIGLINLVSESSVGSSNRRIEALVGYDAFKDFAVERSLAQALSTEFKVPREQILERIQNLTAELKQAERKIADFERAALNQQLPELLKSVETVGQTQLLAAEVKNVANSDDLRSLALSLREKLGSGSAAVALLANIAGKPTVIVAVNAEANTQGIKAGELVKTASTVLDGGGGGRPDLAQGGGNDVSKLPEAIAAIRALIS